MSRSRRVMAVVAILLGLALPVQAHSVHSHNCWSQHGYVYDSPTWQHDARRVYTQNGTRVQAAIYHWEWVAGDGLNRWFLRHGTQTIACVV